MGECKRCHNHTKGKYCQSCMNDVYEQQRITNYKVKVYEPFGEL